MKIVKGSMTVYESKKDICDGDSKSQMTKLVKAFLGIENGCPIGADKVVCFRNKKIMKLTKSAIRLLPSTGIDKSRSFFHADIVHDTGKSCFEGEFEVLNKS